ncbi:MAG: DUF433 domain-containing protein [Chloroflexota bacterium]
MASVNKTALTDRIVMDREIMLGKPTVRGTRIPVELILEQLSYDLDMDELLAAYPRLTREDVLACIAFAGEMVRRKRYRAATTKANVAHRVPAG